MVEERPISLHETISTKPDYLQAPTGCTTKKNNNKQETCSHALGRYHYQFCRSLQFLYKRVHRQSLDTENDGRKRKRRSLTEHSLYFLWQDLNKQFKISMKLDLGKWLKKSVFLLQNLELVVIFYSKM